MKKDKKNHSIPGFFRYLESKNNYSLPLYPLEFQIGPEGKQEFVLADSTISASKFKTGRMDVNLAGITDRKIKYRDMSNFPLLVSDRGTLITGPKFRDYTKVRLERDIEAQKVLTQLGLERSAWDMGGLCLRLADDHTVSLGPAISSYFVEPPEEKGFSEYVFMGDSDRLNRLTLLAGLGYLASRASVL